MHLNELKALHVSEVLKQAEALEIENVGRMRKQELMFAIIKKRAKAGEIEHSMVILLDSITRLARAYNNGAPSSGKALSCGVESRASSCTTWMRSSPWN